MKNTKLREFLKYLKRFPTFRHLSKSRLSLIGLGIVLFFLFIAILAPFLPKNNPYKLNLGEKLQPPSQKFPLGTDVYGRCIYSRIISGAQVTLASSFIIVSISMFVGSIVGVFSGFIGGRFDASFSRIVDGMMSFPPLILAIALTGALGPGLQNAMIALTITYIPHFIRIGRSQALSIKQELFIEAAVASGLSNIRILIFHMLPNCLGPPIIQGTLYLGRAIIEVASLGFLGFGAQPPLAEWGADVALGVAVLREAPWVAAFPGLFILIPVLGFNLLGDGLIEILHPRLRERR